MSTLIPVRNTHKGRCHRITPIPPVPVPWPSLVEQLRPVQQAKRQLIDSGWLTGKNVRPEILRSWRRSLGCGVRAGLTAAPTALRDSTLKVALEENRLLLEAAQPLLAELATLIGGSGQVITLCDASARVLLLCGDRGGRRAAERINLAPGADWSEAGAGTNAMGLALTEAQPVLVLAAEHFCSGWEHWSCAAAPVRDPVTGQPVGILDISGAYTVLNEHALAAVVAAARAIEGRMFQARLASQHRPVTACTGGPGDPARKGHQPGAAAAASPHLPEVVGHHPQFLQVVEYAARAARSDATVLITGETGTGKEVLARAIHQASLRARGPFVAVNCGALAPALAASELFGYTGGAFTGASPRGSTGKVEAADGGTLFLDEVGELPPDVQVLLLRLLQEKEIVRVGSHRPVPVNVRVLAATNRDLELLVARNQFRVDLYYRLKVVHLHLPPLRERRTDIPALVRHALARCGVPDRLVPPDTIARLQAYHWPGNVRELFNLVERSVALGEDLVAGLPQPALPAPAQDPPMPVPGASPERASVLAALAATGGNAAAAARRLGIGRSTLYRKLRALGIRVERQAR